MRRRLLATIAVLAAAVGVVLIVAVGIHAVQERGRTATADPTTPASPTKTAAQKATSSERRAFAVADRFCQPALTQTAWQTGLDPYLTASARTLFAATDPANVPCEHVSATGRQVGDRQTATAQAWEFPAADGGPVLVSMTRTSASSPWLASYVQPNASNGTAS